MGLKNGTSAYNMVYGDNPLFVNIIDEKETLSTNTIELIDLPTISMTAIISFANQCTFPNQFMGQLVLFRDKITGTVISTLRDPNCVISQDNYPLTCVDKCVIPGRGTVLNSEDEEFYRESYFKLASQIQKTNRESFITIVPIRCPTDEEMISYTKNETFDNDHKEYNELKKMIIRDFGNELSAAAATTTTTSSSSSSSSSDEIFAGSEMKIVRDEPSSSQLVNKNKSSRKKIKMLINEPIFITRNEVVRMGCQKEWALNCYSLLKRFEGIVLFIAQDIIRRLLEILPEKNSNSIRHVLLMSDGKCHPIKKKERNTRRVARENNNSMFPYHDYDDCPLPPNLDIEKNNRCNMLKRFLLRIPSCIVHHYLTNVLRIPLVCRLESKSVHYDRTDWSEAETVMVHLAGYLCNLSLPHVQALENKKLIRLSVDDLLSSTNEHDATNKRCRNLTYQWNEFRERIKCDSPFVINLYSSDNDVLHKWNLCASHSVALNGRIRIPSHVTGVRFYRSLVKSTSKRWMSHGVPYQACYELTVTHVPHDVDAGMLLMILCGSDYNDPGITFNGESLKMVYREVLNFKKVACTCHRGWRDYAALVNNSSSTPSYMLESGNTTTCQHCCKVIVKQFWEAKSFFASIASSLMKELDPKLLLSSSSTGDNIANHRKVAINCVCNICAFLLLGKFNKIIYGPIRSSEAMLCVLEREKTQQQQHSKRSYYHDSKNKLKSIADLIKISSYIVKFDKSNKDEYTPGGIRRWCGGNDNGSDPPVNSITTNNNNKCYNRKSDENSDDRVRVLDVSWKDRDFKVLSSDAKKNGNFWKCIFDTSVILPSMMKKTTASSPPLSSQADKSNHQLMVVVDDDVLFRKLTINECLTNKSFSLSNKDVMATITNKLKKNIEEKKISSTLSCCDSRDGNADDSHNNNNNDDNVSAVKRFIDLILTIYLYIIGEDFLTKFYRVPREHDMGGRTNKTIKDMIIECSYLWYSEKIRFTKNYDDHHHLMSDNKIFTALKEFQSSMNWDDDDDCKEYDDSKIKNNIDDDSSLIYNEEIDATEATTNNVNIFPYTPLLGEARCFTPLTLWTVYLSLRSGTISL
uniref:Wsv139-like protein n=1 Tax=Litopenaeus vannamei majanivirus Nimav-1_LVa TaxID=2984273 RepID=A0A9C7BLQ7_9VIRU|nr:MAG: wsv139-like protein [Litopenaeus vannamei majanivirus Nimav-1_LVa]